MGPRGVAAREGAGAARATGGAARRERQTLPLPSAGRRALRPMMSDSPSTYANDMFMLPT